MDDYSRYLSMLLAPLSIQAANGSTKAELKRTSEMAFAISVTARCLLLEELDGLCARVDELYV